MGKILAYTKICFARSNMSFNPQHKNSDLIFSFNCLCAYRSIIINKYLMYHFLCLIVIPHASKSDSFCLAGIPLSNNTFRRWRRYLPSCPLSWCCSSWCLSCSTCPSTPTPPPPPPPHPPPTPTPPHPPPHPTPHPLKQTILRYIYTRYGKIRNRVTAQWLLKIGLAPKT